MDLYERVVGEGGCSPEYFLHRMQLWELRRYLDGLYRRSRPMGEFLRLHAWITARLLGSKVETPEEMLPFVWEQEPIDLEQEERDITALLERCRQENKRHHKQPEQ